MLGSLHAEGLAPGDIDAVVFTHLHRDHVGWTSNVAPSPTTPSGQVTGLTFARARHLVDRAEWDHWNGTAETTGPDPGAVQKPLAGVIEFFTGTQILPGLQAVPTPGHTPGHTSLLVTDPATEERLLILGDAMHTQAQVSETHWNFLSDTDPARSTQHRVDLLDLYQDERTIIAGGHFAGSVFGRFRPATLRSRWATATP